MRTITIGDLEISCYPEQILFSVKEKDGARHSVGVPWKVWHHNKINIEPPCADPGCDSDGVIYYCRICHAPRCAAHIHEIMVSAAAVQDYFIYYCKNCFPT